MSSETWPVYSPSAREHFGRGKDEGRATDSAVGRAAAWTAGWAEGWAEGYAEEHAKAVVKVLAARGIEVPEDARTRILGCSDLEQLDVWLYRAVVAKSITEVFS